MAWLLVVDGLCCGCGRLAVAAAVLDTARSPITSPLAPKRSSPPSACGTSSFSLSSRLLPLPLPPWDLCWDLCWDLPGTFWDLNGTLMQLTVSSPSMACLFLLRMAMVLLMEVG